MTRNPSPANSPNQPLEKFLEIYEKMVSESRSFAIKMTDSIKRDVSKNDGKLS